MLDTNLYIRPDQVKPLGVPSHQQRKVLNFVRGLQRLEKILFQALHLFYFSKGRKEICHNAALILSRVLSARFGLPVSQTLPPDTDHIEIVIGIHSPADMSQAGYQTYLKIFIAGQTFYVDPTFLPIFQDKLGIVVRHYPKESFQQELSREFNIDRYHPDHPAHQHSSILISGGLSASERMGYVEAALRVLHDPKMIDERSTALVGFDALEWSTLDRAIRMIEPRAALPPLEGELARIAASDEPHLLFLLLPSR